MKPTSHRLRVFVLALATASAALAQGTITQNSVQFVRNTSCWDTSPSANFLGVSTPLTQDHLFESGWWFRIMGDTQETAFPVPDSQSYVGSQSQNVWNDVGGRGLFSAQETVDVSDRTGTSPAGVVHMKMTIHNLSGIDPLWIWVYHMVDFDLQPTANDDTAKLAEWTPLHILQINDAGANFAQYAALPFQAQNFLVRPFGSTDVGAVLSDAEVTSFDDTGVPFGPADFTGGYEFFLLIPPNLGGDAEVFLAVNFAMNCDSGAGLLCDGFEHGDTSVWSSSVP